MTLPQITDGHFRKFPIFEVTVRIPQEEMDANLDIGCYTGNVEKEFFDHQPSAGEVIRALDVSNEEFFEQDEKRTIEFGLNLEKKAIKDKKLKARHKMFIDVLTNAEEMQEMPVIKGDHISSCSASIGKSENITVNGKSYSKNLPSIEIHRIWVRMAPTSNS